MQLNQILFLGGAIAIGLALGIAAWKRDEPPNWIIVPVLAVWEVFSLQVSHRVSVYLMLNYGILLALVPRLLRELSSKLTAREP